jgi:heme exporter protein D
MRWTSFAEFAAMGGYGFYVWGAYLVTVAVIGLEIFQVVARHRAARRDLRRPEAS